MQYIALIYVNPDSSAPVSARGGGTDRGVLRAAGRPALRRRRATRAGTQLATTVRSADGQALITDGPFAETKEFLGGYYLLEADDLDAALQFAARMPAARQGGAIEVRPLVAQ